MLGRILLYIIALPVAVVAYLMILLVGFAILALSVFAAPVSVWRLVGEFCKKDKK